MAEEIKQPDVPTVLSTTTRYLPVMLTHEEMVDRVDEYQQTLRLQTEMDDRHKANVLKQKGEKETMASRVSAEGKIIEARAEERRVEVKMILYRSNLTVAEVRMDTGEQISSRPAKQDELQQMVPFEAPGGAIMDEVAERINAGELDTEDVKVTVTRGGKGKPGDAE